MFGGDIGIGFGDATSRPDAGKTSGQPALPQQSPGYVQATVAGVPPKFDFVEHWTTQRFARGLARGDFNGDGRDDLAMVGAEAGGSSFAARVYLYLQTPAGTFAAPEVVDIPRVVLAAYVIGVTAGDFNEDGKDDLVMTTQVVGSGLMAMVSTPGGGYAWREDHWNNGYPSYALPQVSDQDGDGHLDVILSLEDAEIDNEDPNPNQLATWFGDGTGSFPRHAAIESVPHNPGLWLGQLDGAGPLDVVSVGYGHGDEAAVYRADGAGGWHAPTPLLAVDDDDAFVFGTAFDTNGDGREDAVMNRASVFPRLAIYLQQPNGTLASTPQWLASGARSFLDRPVDLDGDGRRDLLQVAYNQTRARFSYLLQDAYGLDYPIDVDVDVSRGHYDPMAIAVGDFNGDGTPDVAISTRLDDDVRVWRGRLTPYAGAGTLPGAPSVLSATTNGFPWMAEATVTLAAPANTGGTPIVGYTVYATPGGGIDADAGSASLVHKMTGLAGSTAYTFRARAINAAGKGPPSAPGGAVVTASPDTVLDLYVDSAFEDDVLDTTITIRPWLRAPAPAGGVSFTLATQDGTAHAGSDYEAMAPTTLTIPAGERSAPEQTITIHGDFDVEGTENFQVVASNVQGMAPIAPVTVQLYEDDTNSLRVALGTIHPVEGDSGKARYNLPVVLSQAAATDVVVYADSTSEFDPAQAGTDYELAATQVVIPAGQTTASIPVDIIGDTTYEHAEVFHVFASLAPFPYNGGTYPSVAYIEIADNDPQPTLSLTPTTVQEGNDDVTVAHFTATLSAPQPDDAWFTFETVAGTATPGVDFEDVRHSGLVIRAGNTQLDIPVTVYGDTRAEGNEQFGGHLVGPFKVLLGTPTAAATILDNDAGTGISVIGVSQPEGNGAGTARFVVELAAPQPGPVTFSARTSDGTAFAGSDYSAIAVAGQVIPPGQLRAYVDVTVLGDALPEGDETFGLEITQASGATPVRARALARLLNDDVPAISIADASAVEGTGSYPAIHTMHFEVTLSVPATTDVVYWLEMGSGGTATPGADMTYGGFLPFVIDAGRTRQSFDIEVYGDSLPEPDETFELKLAAAHGATIGDGTGIGTIIDDDGASVSTATMTRGKLRRHLLLKRAK